MHLHDWRLEYCNRTWGGFCGVVRFEGMNEMHV